MRKLVRFSIFAALAGAISALPMVFSMFVAFDWQKLPWIIGAPFILICPPWELFWGVMAHPNGKILLAQISGLVVLFNALLFTPLGAIHLFGKRFGAPAQFSLTGAALVCLLAFGHFYFLVHL